MIHHDGPCFSATNVTRITRGPIITKCILVLKQRLVARKKCWENVRGFA